MYWLYYSVCPIKRFCFICEKTTHTTRVLDKIVGFGDVSFPARQWIRAYQCNKLKCLSDIIIIVCLKGPFIKVVPSLLQSDLLLINFDAVSFWCCCCSHCLWCFTCLQFLSRCCYFLLLLLLSVLLLLWAYLQNAECALMNLQHADFSVCQNAHIQGIPKRGLSKESLCALLLSAVHNSRTSRRHVCSVCLLFAAGQDYRHVQSNVSVSSWRVSCPSITLNKSSPGLGNSSTSRRKEHLSKLHHHSVSFPREPSLV